MEITHRRDAQGGEQFDLMHGSHIPSGCCFFTGPWTVTRSSLRMLRRVTAFCRLLRPVLLLVSFPRSRCPVVAMLVAAGAVCALVVPSNWRTEVVLVVAGVV